MVSLLQIITKLGYPAMLPHSPPVTPHSPTSSAMSEVSPKTPLFPDIVHPVNKPAPVVTIMPKTCLLPRIAPRPASATPIIMKEPMTPIMNNKRRMMDTTVTDKDEIALKRQKNTDAARRSRLKKLVKMEQLEEKVSELESDNQRLTTRIAVLGI